MQKLLSELERDIRNQGLIDNLKRLNRKQKIMITFRRYPLHIAATALAFLWIIACMTVVHAEDKVLHASDVAAGAPEWKDIKYPCPTPGQPCKILILSPQEEAALMQQNGVLDTAAQARSLDLGQFAVYLKTKIASAPQGEMQPVPAKPDLPKTPDNVKPN